MKDTLNELRKILKEGEQVYKIVDYYELNGIECRTELYIDYCEDDENYSVLTQSDYGSANGTACNSFSTEYEGYGAYEAINKIALEILSSEQANCRIELANINYVADEGYIYTTKY